MPRLTSSVIQYFLFAPVVTAALASVVVSTEASATRVTLQDTLALRVANSNQSSELDVSSDLRALPAGSVIELGESGLSGTRYGYRNGSSHKSAEFIGGFKIVSAPGVSAERIQKLNQSQKFISETYARRGKVSDAAAIQATLATSKTSASKPADPPCPEANGHSPSAQATASNIATAASQSLCDFGDATTQSSCNKFLADPKIPQDALAWTLGVFRDNYKKLKMTKCMRPPPNHYSNPSHDTESELDDKGIKNKCNIQLNDTRQRIKGFPSRATFYFLNLCTGEMKSGYFNLGVGTSEHGSYANEPEKYTTVLGAFLTSDQSFGFNPKSCAVQAKVCPSGQIIDSPAYADLRKKHGGRIPAVTMYGLQNTNNTSAETNKYLHVSPYKSSHGCPSISDDNADIIEEMASRGPTLIVNYGPRDKMEDPKVCSAK